MSGYVDPETMDENYNILSRTTWAPDDTTTITWERQGAVALGTFPSVRHAYLFLNVHLNQENQSGRPSAFKQKDATKSIPNDKKSIDSISLTFDDARNDNNEPKKDLQIFEIEGPVSVPINLAELDTANLREIIDSEPENHNTIAQNDAKYEMLNQLDWSGICTKKIEWRREGQNAVGKFGYCEDASGFIFGYLGGSMCDGDGFLLKETEDSRKYRGRIWESSLRKKSRAYDIKMPERQPWNVPVEVAIPLSFLDANGLKNRLTEYTVETRIVPDSVQPQLPDKNSGPA